MSRLTILLCIFVLAQTEIVPLHRHIIQEVFQENKPYLIYVHGPVHNFQVEAVFNSYCFGEKLCAVLEPNVEGYAEFLQYVGKQEEEYFLMLDANNKRKYILPLPQGDFTQNELLSFEYKVINREIDPYFASQQAPVEVNQRCSRLVGKTVGEFLRRAERIKVILLHSPSKYCPSCEQVLEKYTVFAEENYSVGEVAFGHFDTLLNDHPVIHDEKTPNLLIFIDKNFQNPFELAPGSLDYLRTFIDKTLNKRHRRQAESQEAQRQDM